MASTFSKHATCCATNIFVLLLIISVCIVGCKKDDDTTNNNNDDAQLIFRFKFDSTQVRLNNFGLPASLPSNHRAQSPVFNKMSAHYVELAPSGLVPLGGGAILFKNQETLTGGEQAIDFSKSAVVAESETFLSVPLKDIPPNTYPYLRISLAYQNYDIKVRALGISMLGTIASFIGYNTYIGSFLVKQQNISVNANKKQGYWAFETPYSLTQGQAPAGATTVPNPIFTTSPVPAGSCVVTGNFEQPLVISGQETEDIVVTVSLSTNKSFEWSETGNNNTFDPLDGDVPTDMGIRGLIGYW